MARLKSCPDTRLFAFDRSAKSENGYGVGWQRDLSLLYGDRIGRSYRELGALGHAEAERGFRKIQGEDDCAAAHGEPLLLFIELKVDFFERAIGERWVCVAEGDQFFVPGEYPGVLRLLNFVPIEFRALEGCGVLRVGDFVRTPSEGLEFLLAAFGDEAAELHVFVIGEVLERGGRGPLLALEEHGHEGRGKDERSGDLCAAGAGELREPLALRAVADLVVILRVAEETPCGEIGDRAPVNAIAIGGVASVVDEDLLQ